MTAHLLHLVHGRFVCLATTLEIGAVSVAVPRIGIARSLRLLQGFEAVQRSMLITDMFCEEGSNAVLRGVEEGGGLRRSTLDTDIDIVGVGGFAGR